MKLDDINKISNQLGKLKSNNKKDRTFIISGIIKGGMIITIFVIVYKLMTAYIFNQSQTTLNNIYDQVVEDSITQYNIVNRNGTESEKCVHAGMVAAAYLQAKNESGYKGWKIIESQKCKTDK